MAERLETLSLEAVAAGCRDESRRARGGERGWCFELFRRAIDEQNQAAWAALAEQYHRLMLEWVYALRASADEADEAAREALERFWRTLAGRGDPLAQRFPHVGALLKYLQQCAVTTMLDRRRRAARLARLAERLRSAPPIPADAPDEAAVERIARAEQLARVRRWVADAVGDPAERRVLQLSYERGLTPAEIAAGYPAEFSGVEQVRQIKERVLRRARRALVEPGEQDV